ncbi:MAG: hypothetical protein OEZ33_11125, partial [Gammaproteobacteria bacterium]|nr:hypothetical protein [Gammaproteobacteria bacterium]
TKITDESLRHLANLKELRRLNLRKTKVTDAGLENLKRNSKLEALDLAYVDVNGSGFIGFSADLIELYLNNTKTNDEGIKIIAEFKNLQVLDLSGTRVTDNAVPELMKLSALTSLTLYNCSLTNAGKEKLRKHMPGTKILF